MTVFNKHFSEGVRKSLETISMLKSEDVADCVVYALSTPEHLQVEENVEDFLNDGGF